MLACTTGSAMEYVISAGLRPFFSNLQKGWTSIPLLLTLQTGVARIAIG